jgi:hypothetical protein
MEAVYRAHVFTSTGTFSVSASGTFGDTVEYLVVAGGGGGAPDAGGGGQGAGANPAPADAGTDNTGGGGGGGEYDQSGSVPSTNYNGRNGGSGIVVIRYQV